MNIQKDHPLLMMGVMSGTSVDGLDIAIVRMDAPRPVLIHYHEQPMPYGLREPILRLAEPGINEIDALGELDRALGESIADAVHDTLQEAQLKPEDITAIGSHGQTIRHRPQVRFPFSLQIGCPSTIAERTGITTVADFRRRDMAAGGEGAPLMPFVHRLLFTNQDTSTAVLNIGGIANVTFLGAHGELFGFDTGPGNMVMDGLMLALSDGRYAYDAHGELAATGHVCSPLLEQLMTHPFLRHRPPKSCGREEFGQKNIEQILCQTGISDADRLRTALEFTVLSIAQARHFLPEPPATWHLYGGGTQNNFLMQKLAEALAPAKIELTDTNGIPAQAFEAMGFAILAWYTLKGQCNTLFETTGARHAVCAGHIVPGTNWMKVLSDSSIATYPSLQHTRKE